MMVLSHMDITHENIISKRKKGVFVSQEVFLDNAYIRSYIKDCRFFHISPKRMALRLMNSVNLW